MNFADKDREDGFVIHRNPESPDLWPLVRALRDGSAKGIILSKRHPDRCVHLLEWEGARHIVKHVLRGRPPWEKKLQERIRGPFYSRLMRDVSAARKRGCTVVQNMHLVAERMENGICRETYIVLEYVEGKPFASSRECREHGEQTAAAMRELHRFHLALGDVNHTNFVKNADAVTIIDLSARGSFRLGKIKDAVRMRMHYGTTLPVRGIVDKTLFALIFVHQQLFYRIRLFRNMKTNPLRSAGE